MCLKCLSSLKTAAYSLGGLLLSATVLTKESAMHDILKQQAAQLARLAMMIRIGLDSAGVWWRHPTHRVHYRSGADPEDPDTSGRTARTHF